MGIFAPGNDRGVRLFSNWPSYAVCYDNLGFLHDGNGMSSVIDICTSTLYHKCIGNELSGLHIHEMKYFWMCRWRVLHSYIYGFIVASNWYSIYFSWLNAFSISKASFPIQWIVGVNPISVNYSNISLYDHVISGSDLIFSGSINGSFAL